jgi:hypothetical protein
MHNPECSRHRKFSVLYELSTQIPFSTFFFRIANQKVYQAKIKVKISLINEHTYAKHDPDKHVEFRRERVLLTEDLG